MTRFVSHVAHAAIVAVLCTTALVSAQDIDADRVARELRPEIERTLLEGKIPSAAVALVAGDQIIWTDGFGFSNLWARTPAVPGTVYLIGSTFKAMSTYALLQQMEQGKFQLDDRVNDYLDGFQIEGEDPEHPVTFRHLLTHTSGLPVAFGAHPVWGDTVPPPLEEYLRASLKVSGPPQKQVVYSNMAYTLVAYLVEQFSGVPYKEHMQKNIFEPLEMDDTVFMPAGETIERLAVPYLVDSGSGRPTPATRLKADVWPAGIVYGTVTNQANWLIANLGGGVFKDHRLISAETFDQMMTRQYDEFAAPVGGGWLNETTGYGLTWWISERDGEKLFAHSGSVPGYTAFLCGNLEKKTGFAILTNGNRAHPHLYKLALKALDLMEAHRRER